MEPLSALYGRASEQEALARWADGLGPARLLLCGPPGIGKSALLAALARERDCWLLDCAQMDTLEQLCLALSALRPWQAPPEITLAALEGALAPLILLDHAEGLGEQVLALQGPTRWLIATQRQLPGEQIMQLEGLDMAASYELLGLHEATTPTLDALIERCEGSPLALRLVWSRLARMSPEELLERLGQGALLTKKAIQGRSMEQIVSLAWERLEPHLQQLWSACAVWEVVFTVADAELVAPLMPHDVLVCDALEALEASSLLQYREDGWHMVETLRLFAKRVDPQGFAKAHARMVEGICAQAEQAAIAHYDGAPAARQALLSRQQLLMRLMEQGEGARRPRLLYALMSLLAEQGLFSTILRWTDAMAPAPALDQLTLEMHLFAVLALAFTGDLTGALARYDKLRPWVSQLPSVELFDAYTGGLLLTLRADYAQAHERLAHACQLARVVGDIDRLARTLSLIGNVFVREQRWEEALAAYDESIQISQESGQEVEAMRTYGNRASMLLAMGRLEEAIAALELAADFAQTHQELRNLCVLKGNLGVAYLIIGNLDASAQALDRALDLSHTQREPRSLCRQLITRAQVSLEMNQATEALPWLERAGALIEGIRSPNTLWEHHATRALYHWRCDQAALAQGWVERAQAVQAGAAPTPEADLEPLLCIMRRERPLLPARHGCPLNWVIWRLYGQGHEQTLFVAADGSGFRIDQAHPVWLGRSASSWRLLAALAAQAAQNPTQLIEPWALFEAGWPDEVGVPRSGLNRLYTAISRLRSAGLGDWLETVPDGYRLRAPVSLVDPERL